MLLIVVTTGDHHQGLVVGAVHQPVVVVDAARPEAGKVFLQGFGFAYALKGVAEAILEQGIDALEGLAVLALPVFVIVPSG